jgi:hypothetical protein
MTQTGQFLGKVQYASPEQFGGQIDGRSDLYSFGVVLYNLLTNADAFVGENPREIITAHLFHPPRRFEEANPGVRVPEAVQRVIYRALEKDPDKRYHDALEFSAAIEEAFDVHDAGSYMTRPARTASDALVARTAVDTTVVSGPTEAATFVPAAPTVVEHRARRLPIIVIAALVVLALAAAGVFIWRQREAAALARYGKFYAVVIGESKYRKFDELPTAADDARAVGQLLQSKYGFEVTPLENAGRDEILAALNATRKRMTNADNLLVFYAGHGTLLNDKGYWQPVDADREGTIWISPANIRDVLIDTPARRTLIIADSCYSGALARGALSSPATPARIDKRSRMVISSGGNEPVTDSADGHHSIFTKALLEVLGDPGRKAVDVQSIFGPIRDRVVDAARRDGREQKPQLAVIAEVGDEGGTFFFVPR